MLIKHDSNSNYFKKVLINIHLNNGDYILAIRLILSILINSKNRSTEIFNKNSQNEDYHEGYYLLVYTLYQIGNYSKCNEIGKKIILKESFTISSDDLIERNYYYELAGQVSECSKNLNKNKEGITLNNNNIFTEEESKFQIDSNSYFKFSFNKVNLSDDIIIKIQMILSKTQEKMDKLNFYSKNFNSFSNLCQFFNWLENSFYPKIDFKFYSNCNRAVISKTLIKVSFEFKFRKMK